MHEIDHAANEMFAQLTKQMTAAEGVTEALKAAGRMEWVRHTNSIRSRVREIVNSERIYNLVEPGVQAAVCGLNSGFTLGQNRAVSI